MFALLGNDVTCIGCYTQNSEVWFSLLLVVPTYDGEECCGTRSCSSCPPQCFQLLCDFHCAQAVERWVNKGTNGVHPTDKALVTDAFRRLAYAATGKIMNIFRDKTMYDAYKFVMKCN